MSYGFRCAINLLATQYIYIPYIWLLYYGYLIYIPYIYIYIYIMYYFKSCIAPLQVMQCATFGACAIGWPPLAYSHRRQTHRCSNPRTSEQRSHHSTDVAARSMQNPQLKCSWFESHLCPFFRFRAAKLFSHVFCDLFSCLFVVSLSEKLLPILVTGGLFHMSQIDRQKFSWRLFSPTWSRIDVCKLDQNDSKVLQTWENFGLKYRRIVLSKLRSSLQRVAVTSSFLTVSSTWASGGENLILNRGLGVGGPEPPFRGTQSSS